MAVNKFCEVCSKAGLISNMVAKQVNMEEALLICENIECVFPLGTPRFSTFIISRSLDEKSNYKPTRKNVGLIVAENNKAVHEDKKCTKILHWQNVDALCWLDSALSLLVHNRTIKQLLSRVQTCENSLLNNVVDQYSKAQYLSEFDLPNATKVLEDVRSLVWTYLCPKMKCTVGVNDSPLFALSLLFRENAVTADNCVLQYTCKFTCQECGHNETTRHKKYIVTFPNTPKDFNIQDCAFKRPCSKCASQDQFSTVIYERLPDVVLLHFVEGLKSAEYLDYQFTHQNNSYCLTQFIQYVQDPDHFICWTKEDDGSRWLELDDLKPPLCSWSSPPKVSPSQIHIIVLQKVVNNNTVSPEEGLESRLHCSDMQHKDSEVSSEKTECTRDDKPVIKTQHKDIEVNKQLSENSECTRDDKPVIKTHHKDIEVNKQLSENSECTRDDKPAIKTQDTITMQDITSDLHSKLKVGANDHGTPVVSTTKRLPLKNCSSENTTPVCTPSIMKDIKCAYPKTPLQPSSLQLGHTSGNSLFRVALKRLSSDSKVQPLLPKKRRTLLTPFQPYVPKKERHQVDQVTTVSENEENRKASDDALSPTDSEGSCFSSSDSGYSSPSSVSSCGSTFNMDLRSKDECNDIADQLEKLLPDCLLDEMTELKPIHVSYEQDELPDCLLDEITELKPIHVSYEQDELPDCLLDEITELKPIHVSYEQDELPDCLLDEITELKPIHVSYEQDELPDCLLDEITELKPIHVSYEQDEFIHKLLFCD